LLLEAIASGELDLHLLAIARAIDARIHLLHTMRSIDALAELVVGDLVRISHRARPRYLHGQRAMIVDVDAQAATIRFERLIGRFTSDNSGARHSPSTASTPHAAENAPPRPRDCLQRGGSRLAWSTVWWRSGLESGVRMRHPV
jgi:hypothetical protein